MKWHIVLINPIISSLLANEEHNSTHSSNVFFFKLFIVLMQDFMFPHRFLTYSWSRCRIHDCTIFFVTYSWFRSLFLTLTSTIHSFFFSPSFLYLTQNFVYISSHWSCSDIDVYMNSIWTNNLKRCNYSTNIHLSVVNIDVQMKFPSSHIL